MTQYRRDLDISTCCNNWKHGIRTINGQYPDDNREFKVNGGAGIVVTPATAGITITNTTDPEALEAGQNIELTPNGDKLTIGTTDDIAVAGDLSVAGDSTLNGDLNINGDIFQQGASYESHMEQVYTTDDYIIMRDGAVAALPSGDYAGFQVKKYDGTNDGRLVIDNTGTARVGDVGDEQPLLTREESANLNDGALLKWDASTSKAVDEGTVGSDTKPIKIVNGIATAVTYDVINTNETDQKVKAPFTISSTAGAVFHITSGRELTTISSSTAIANITFNATINSTPDSRFARIETRRYADRTRMWATLFAFNRNNEETALYLDQYDSGRVVLGVVNTVGGVATNHSLLDSNP